MELPDIERLYQEFPDYAIVTVNGDPENNIQGFVAEHRLNFTVLLEERGKPMSQIYGFTAYPTSYFIDEAGIVREVHMGLLTFDEMKEKMDGL